MRLYHNWPLRLEVETYLEEDADSEEEEVAENHQGGRRIRMLLEVLELEVGKRWLYYIHVFMVLQRVSRNVRKMV